MERKHIQGNVYRNVFRRDKQYLWHWITEECPRAKSQSTLIPVSHFFLQAEFCLEVNVVCECRACGNVGKSKSLYYVFDDVCM